MPAWTDLNRMGALAEGPWEAGWPGQTNPQDYPIAQGRRSAPLDPNVITEPELQRAERNMPRELQPQPSWGPGLTPPNTENPEYTYPGVRGNYFDISLSDRPPSQDTLTEADREIPGQGSILPWYRDNPTAGGWTYNPGNQPGGRVDLSGVPTEEARPSGTGQAVQDLSFLGRNYTLPGGGASWRTLTDQGASDVLRDTGAGTPVQDLGWLRSGSNTLSQVPPSYLPQDIYRGNVMQDIGSIDTVRANEPGGIGTAWDRTILSTVPQHNDYDFPGWTGSQSWRPAALGVRGTFGRRFGPMDQPSWTQVPTDLGGGFNDDFASRYPSGTGSPPDWATLDIQRGGFPDSGGGGPRDPVYASGATYPIVNDLPIVQQYDTRTSLPNNQVSMDTSEGRYYAGSYTGPTPVGSSNSPILYNSTPTFLPTYNTPVLTGFNMAPGPAPIYGF